MGMASSEVAGVPKGRHDQSCEEPLLTYVLLCLWTNQALSVCLPVSRLAGIRRRYIIPLGIGTSNVNVYQSVVSHHLQHKISQTDDRPNLARWTVRVHRRSPSRESGRALEGRRNWGPYPPTRQTSSNNFRLRYASSYKDKLLEVDQWSEETQKNVSLEVKELPEHVKYDNGWFDELDELKTLFKFNLCALPSISMSTWTGKNQLKTDESSGLDGIFIADFVDNSFFNKHIQKVLNTSWHQNVNVL